MDHTQAALDDAEIYSQYKSWIRRSKKIRFKRNVGRRGETWFKKGDVALGFETISGWTAFSDRGRRDLESYKIHWCGEIDKKAIEVLDEIGV